MEWEVYEVFDIEIQRGVYGFTCSLLRRIVIGLEWN